MDTNLIFCFLLVAWAVSKEQKDDDITHNPFLFQEAFNEIE